VPLSAVGHFTFISCIVGQKRNQTSTWSSATRYSRRNLMRNTFLRFGLHFSGPSFIARVQLMMNLYSMGLVKYSAGRHTAFSLHTTVDPVAITPKPRSLIGHYCTSKSLTPFQNLGINKDFRAKGPKGSSHNGLWLSLSGAGVWGPEDSLFLRRTDPFASSIPREHTRQAQL
jgi:hypothetical protein